ncbi:MAG: N-acetylneuraminate lyase, partial [Dorea sp.]|nr:N-acetylneuraminate lyase [Dorea sp.]
HGNLYAVMKEILKDQGLEFGGVRKPLPSVTEEDLLQIEKCKRMIQEAVTRYC